MRSCDPSFLEECIYSIAHSRKSKFQQSYFQVEILGYLMYFLANLSLQKI